MYVRESEIGVVDNIVHIDGFLLDVDRVAGMVPREWANSSMRRDVACPTDRVLLVPPNYRVCSTITTLTTKKLCTHSISIPHTIGYALFYSALSTGTKIETVVLFNTGP